MIEGNQQYRPRRARWPLTSHGTVTALMVIGLLAALKAVTC